MSLIITMNDANGQGVTQNFTGDGNGNEFSYNGRKGAIGAFGNIGGGTLTLELSLNGGATWVADPSFSVTAVPSDPIYIAREVPSGLKYRFVLTGSTTPNLNVFFYQGATS